jgi:phage shock protein PspC (stress-responsive transcriptional regulator)
MPAKRIYRNPREKVIAGVCAGIADYFDVDVAWVRLAFVLSVFASGFGVVAYVVAWIVFPKDERLPGASELAAPPAESSAVSAARQIRRSGYSHSRNAVGIVLVLLGVVFFMDENFWWFRFDAFWPVILIGLGLYLVLRPSAQTEAESHPTVAVAGTPDSHSSGTISDGSHPG